MNRCLVSCHCLHLMRSMLAQLHRQPHGGGEGIKQALCTGLRADLEPLLQLPILLQSSGSTVMRSMAVAFLVFLLLAASVAARPHLQQPAPSRAQTLSKFTGNSTEQLSDIWSDCSK